MANEVKIRVVAEDKTKGTFSGLKTGLASVAKGAAVMGAAVLGGALAAVKGASDLSETINKSNVIFGKNAGHMKSWSATAASSMGLSQQAALEAASSFGDMFQQIGVTGDNAVIASKKVVQMAADLGSFHNLDTEDVLQRIQAGFRGEYDSLQQLIPNINAARVQKEALAMTGKKHAESLTAEEKALATYTIIQKDGKAAMGDFKRTQDGLANSLKIVKARLIDARDHVGKLIEPAAKAAVQWFIDKGLPAVEGFVRKLSKNKDLKKSIKDLGAALGGLTDKDFAGTLSDIADELPTIVDNLTKAVDAVGKFSTTVDDFENKTGKKEGGPLGGMANAVERNIKKLGNAIQGGWNKMTAWVVAKAGELKDKVVAKTAELKDRVVAWFKRMWTQATDILKQRLNEAVDGVKRFVGRVVDWISKLPGRAKSALGSLAAKIGSEVEQAKNLALRKVKDLANRFVDWVRGIPGKSKSALSSLAAKIGSEVEQAKDNVLRKARDMVNRFIDRMQQLVRDARDYAGRVKGAITGKFAGARDWLVTAGRNVIRGLGDGLRLAFNAVKKWVSGIASWIKAHKGPVSLDRQLLHPAGRALMEGLLGGLKFGFKGVGDFVYKVGGKISDVISKIKDSMFGGFGNINFGKLPSGGYRALGRAMAAAYGWTGANWNALNALWTRESGWNPRARNPSSGAAGIPQDITGNFHGGAAGQIAWGLRYIKGRYGSPLKAWAHSQRTGWYDQGGMLPSGGIAMNASGRPERILSPVQTRSFDRMVRAMERGGGVTSTTIIINAPNYVGSHEDLKRALVDLNRRGQLEVIKR